MNKYAERTFELLDLLSKSKANLANSLVLKGEEADEKEPLDNLVQKAADYTPKSYILVDEDGNELAGVLVDEVTVFDATENDVREGKVFASETGVKTGEKFIPSYNTTEGYRIITNGSAFTIPTLDWLDLYDFTKLQIIICPYANSIASSVSAEKVGIGEKIYAVNSTEVISEIVRDSENKAINLGITNESGSLYVLRYFTYKEIY